MLNDSRQKEVQEFVVALSQKGHEQGFLTFDQIIDALPDSIDPGQVNDIVKRLLALGVNVCEEAPVVEDKNPPGSSPNVHGRDPVETTFVPQYQEPHKHIYRKEDVLESVNSLIETGREQRYLTYSQIDDALQQLSLDSDHLDDIRVLFEDMGIWLASLGL